MGVARKQVTIPVVFEKQLFIPTPLSLFSAKTRFVISFKPTGVSSISISLIADPCIFAFKTPESYFSPVVGLTKDKSGGDEYPFPPSSISISVISLRSTTVKFGEMKTSGFNVLSAEKSNP